MGLSPATLLDLVRAAGSLAEGMAARVELRPDDSHDAIGQWCTATGNTVSASGPGWAVIRRGQAASHHARPVSERVWIYTNFDCNLKCDYCCVRSAPGIPTRGLGLERIESIASEAAALGVREIFMTGGEPFLLPYIDRAAIACAAAAETTLLTNGMLFRGKRKSALDAMPRTGFALQISLDSAQPGRHDRHRGGGSWCRAIEGIHIAQDLGFRVRVASTIGVDGGNEMEEEKDMHRLCEDLGVPPEDRIIRRLAKRGRAVKGIVLTTQGLIPEVTYTDRGVFWHPVGADDADMMVADHVVPLPDAIERVRRLRELQMEHEAQAASEFTCA